MANILYITGTEQHKRGGVNQVAQGYAAALANSNYQVTFIYGYGPDGYLGIMPKLFRKFDLLLGSFLLKNKINSILKKQQIDLIHAHGIDACFDTAVLKSWLAKKNIKVVATLHGFDQDILQALQEELNLGHVKLSPLTLFHLLYFSLSAQKENFAYPKFDYLFAVSPGIAEKAFKYHHLSAKYLPNCVNITKEKTVLTRTALGIKNEAKVILFIGVSSWLKGFRYLQQIINENYTYLIVGFKLPENILISFPNIINIPYASGQEVSDLFSMSDLFMHTALNEPFGLVYLEAFYHRIPILSFKNDGADLLIKDGETGFTVPLRDTTALANKLKYIFDNPKLVEQITKKAHAQLKNFSYAKHTKELINDYENILANTNILLIPHLIKQNVRSRTEEMAKAFSLAGNNVFILSWEERKEKSYGLTVTNFKYFLREFFRLPIIKIEHGLKKVYLPRLVYPFGPATKLNSLILNWFIRKYHIQKVINAAFLFYKINPKNCEYIYDFVDDHVLYTSHNQRPGAAKLAKQMTKYIARESRKATKLLFVNQALYSKFKQPGKKCLTINNGAFFNEYKSSNPQLRHKLGLGNKFIYGLIGNHGEWSGLETFLNIFKKYPSKLKNSILLIVGPVYNPRLLDNLPHNIKYAGSVTPAQVNDYYALCDVGIQSADDSKFREMTFPLKVIEYTAAKKIVLALSAKNLKEINLPNLIISARDEKSIVKNLLYCQKLEWQDKWNKITMRYDWQNLIKQI